MGGVPAAGPERARPALWLGLAARAGDGRAGHGATRGARPAARAARRGAWIGPGLREWVAPELLRRSDEQHALLRRARGPLRLLRLRGRRGARRRRAGDRRSQPGLLVPQ